MSVVADVIAIDGPSGSGKGTVARLLSARLGWHLLDSGALYRVVAVLALRRGIALTDEPALQALAEGARVQFIERDGEVGVEVNGDDVSRAIRSDEAGVAASQVAIVPGVRRAVLATQHRMQQPPGLVADGRDMGTVVFPAAKLKVFLTASAEERAQRRYKQLIDKGLDASLPALIESIKARDERDASRSISPLKPAPGALIIDCTVLSPAQVVERILDALKR